ncbi:MAG: nucleotidyltransferase domain-containing protein [Patescibacteria group bacterium]
MERVRTKNQIKKIVKQYVKELQNAEYPFSAVYLFGSYANGIPHKWSDIDVAVVSNRLERRRNANEDLLWYIRRRVDSMIEPIGFTPGDFQDECDPMVQEIKRTGIRIV